MPHLFNVGDRVCLKQPLRELSSGHLATVMKTYPAPGLYDVQFDGEMWVRIVSGDMLGGVPGETASMEQAKSRAL